MRHKFKEGDKVWVRKWDDNYIPVTLPGIISGTWYIRLVKMYHIYIDTKEGIIQSEEQFVEARK